MLPNNILKGNNFYYFPHVKIGFRSIYLLTSALSHDVGVAVVPDGFLGVGASSVWSQRPLFLGAGLGSPFAFNVPSLAFSANFFLNCKYKYYVNMLNILNIFYLNINEKVERVKIADHIPQFLPLSITVPA